MKIKAANTTGGPWHPAIHHAADVVDLVWRGIVGAHPRVTGLGEEGHSERSLHYGLPGDVRMRAIDIDADSTRITPDQRVRVDEELRKRLGTSFDILWEHMENDSLAHLHIEYDPEPVG